jgi:hypothetical protein
MIGTASPLFAIAKCGEGETLAAFWRILSANVQSSKQRQWQNAPAVDSDISSLKIGGETSSPPKPLVLKSSAPKAMFDMTYQPGVSIG